MNTIRDMLHAGDVYAEAGIEPLPPVHVPGWNDHDAMFQALAADAKLIVEVGSWLGRSTLALAAAAPRAEIVCIDTWLGSLEMWLDKTDASRYGAMRCIAGYPTIYRDFLQNIISHGYAERVTPFPVASSVGLQWFIRQGIKPCLIYVDGSHEFQDVCLDVTLAMDAGSRYICGDDYRQDWPGVMQAVDLVLPDAHVNAETGFWHWENR